MRPTVPTTCAIVLFSKWRQWRRSVSGVSSILGAIPLQLYSSNLLLPTGCELSKDQKEYKWDSEDEELGKADIEQKLVLSQVRFQICLFVPPRAVRRSSF